MPDRIEKSIDIKAPVERVWRALTDPEEFGAWFGVKMATPFVVGETARGNITHPGYEHIVFEALVVAMEAPRRFVFSGHPNTVDADRDYSAEPPTTTTFTLEPTSGGTRLTVVETGFDGLAADRRDQAYQANTGGWAHQVVNIKTYVEA